LTAPHESTPGRPKLTHPPRGAAATPPGGPVYVPVGAECEIFRAAAAKGHAVMLKGPTGCGKTRFVEAMAHRLGRPLITVACHEDLTAGDLVGRYLLQGGDTVWTDGPLTRAVRTGAICYLDEVVEARADTVVVLHPLIDHRRELHVDRLGETLKAPPGFTLVVSYNPGYQSVLKDLKESTRQRMVSIAFDFLPPEVEARVLMQETGLAEATARQLVKLAQAIRRAGIPGLPEVASTRALVAAGDLHQAGLPLHTAAVAAIVEPLTDDAVQVDGLRELVDAHLPPA